MATAPETVGRHERPLWVELPRSRVRPGRSGVGATPPFITGLAKVGNPSRCGPSTVPGLAGVKIRKVEPELRRWAPGVELPAAGSLRCVARQRRDDDQRHCLGGRGNDFSP